MKNKNKSAAKPSIISISFDNKNAAEGFMEWLCGDGEQMYWEWMKFREQEDFSKNLTALTF